MIRRINGVVALLGRMCRPQPQHVHQPWVVMSCLTHSTSNSGGGRKNIGRSNQQKRGHGTKLKGGGKNSQKSISRSEDDDWESPSKVTKRVPIPLRFSILEDLRTRWNGNSPTKEEIEQSYGVAVDAQFLQQNLHSAGHRTQEGLEKAACDGQLTSSRSTNFPEMWWFLLHKCNDVRRLPHMVELRDMLRGEFAELLEDLGPIERQYVVKDVVNSFLAGEKLFRLAALVTPHDEFYCKYPVYPRGDRPLPPRVREIADARGRLKKPVATTVDYWLESGNEDRKRLPIPLRFRILQQMKQRADQGEAELTRADIERSYGVTVEPYKLMLSLHGKDGLRPYQEVAAAVNEGQLVSGRSTTIPAMYWFLLHKCNKVRKLPTLEELQSMLREEFGDRRPNLSSKEWNNAVSTCATSFLDGEELLRVGALVTPHKALYRKYPVYPRGDKPLPPRVRLIADALGRLGEVADDDGAVAAGNGTTPMADGPSSPV